MTAVIREHDVTVLLGDVREQLATLADGSAQCVVTSPPYYGLRDYGVDGQLGLEASPAEYVETMRAVFTDVRRVLADDGVLWLNLGDSYSGSWGNQSRNETSPGMAPATDGRYPAHTRTGAIREGQPPAKNLMGIPWRVAFALQDDGWILRNAVIWNKPNAMPESVTDRLSTRYEHLFLFSKSRRYWFDLDPIREATASTREAALSWDRDAKMSAVPGQRAQHRAGRDYAKPASRDGRGFAAATIDPHPQQDPGTDGLGMHERGRNPGDVWTIPTTPFPGAHFATMPQALARRCILAGCKPGGTVLDVFAGSGTTLKVARSLGHKSVGIELNPDYIDIIQDRIGPETLNFGESA